MPDTNNQEKRTAAITSILPSRNSFEGNTDIFEPTLVNYFFGRNGVGKSTIAEDIRDSNSGVIYGDNKTSSDYDLKIYDQKYIKENFTDYTGLKGRLIFHKANDEVIKKQADILAKINSATDAIRDSQKKIDNLPSDASIEKSYWDTFWKLTDYPRKTFKKALSGYLSGKESFFKGSLEKLRKITGVAHDVTVLTNEYNSLYSSDLQKYDLLVFPSNAYSYEELPGAKLLDTIITSSSDTPYATFVKSLESISWVQTGVEHYANHKNNPDGLCPFCQQPLPPSFKDDVAMLFDKTYAENIRGLNLYLEQFSRALSNLEQSLRNLLKNPFPDPIFSTLNSQIDVINSRTQECINVIRQKISDPSGKYYLPDIKSDIKDVEKTISVLNVKITANNALFEKKSTKEKELRNNVWEYVVSLLESEYKNYMKSISDRDSQKNSLEKSIADGKKNLADLTKELQETNDGSVPTEDTVSKINDLLHHSNFQGFELRPEQGKENVYAVMRLKDGKPYEVADKLSEGERSFIAFLYFYYDVLGFVDEEENKNKKPKVVVIDDPVSSMDDNALYIISSLVRQLADRCQIRGTLEDDQLGDSQIDQIFILTHNVHFHRDVTIGRTQDKFYDTVSFYLVRKENNHSTVKPCTKEVAAGQMVNYNPVKNSYYALWSEYQELKSPAAVINVMHQILDYYFIQLCGYEGESLPDIILKKRADKFFHIKDGVLDTSEYNLAESLLLRLTSSPTVIADSHFIEDETDVPHYKDIFERIFRAMDQEQHYDMMMESVNWNSH